MPVAHIAIWCNVYMISEYIIMKNKQWCNDDYTNTTVDILNKVQGPQAWHQLQDTLLHIQCSRYNGKEFSWWYGKLQHHPFTKRKDPAVTKNVFVIIVNILYYLYNIYIYIILSYTVFPKNMKEPLVILYVQLLISVLAHKLQTWLDLADQLIYQCIVHQIISDEEIQ